jgi:flavin-dependent dehydrogenase
MEIAVIGAGPAGTWASILLAQHRHSVTLIDPQAPWEKPCGGGVSAKALSRFGVFESSLPRTNIERVAIYFGDTNTVNVTPQKPIAVVSRQELAKFLIQEAENSGVSFIRSRVNRIERTARRWQISARATSLQSDFLIGADGATSLVRRTLGTGLGPEDLCVTLGYFIPGEFTPHMKIYFLPGFEGYIWSFPRPNHTSYGLITRSEPGWSGRAKILLSNFIAADLGDEVLDQAEFYSAPVPCLGPRSWKKNRIAGERWALIGDAAGLADPITGEGIYYAFRSAQILADTINRPEQYAENVGAEIGRDLERAAKMYERFYRGRFLGADFKKRMVQLSRRSKTLRTVLGNLIVGNQNYLGLKRRLFSSIPSVGLDLILRRS